MISSIPTGSKRSGKESRSDPNPDFEQSYSDKDNIYSNKSINPFFSSDINKDKNPSISTIYSNHDPSSELNSTISAKPTIEKDSTSSHLDERSNIQSSNPYLMSNKFDSHHIHSFTKGFDSNLPNDDKSDESNTSLTHNKTNSLMPNVPQCKTNTSSSDDDYDEIYPIPLNDSSNQSNKNALTYRKTRTLSTNKSLFKRFHSKDKLHIPFQSK